MNYEPIIEHQKKYAYLMDMYDQLDKELDMFSPIPDVILDDVELLRDKCWNEAIKEQTKAEIALKNIKI